MSSSFSRKRLASAGTETRLEVPNLERDDAGSLSEKMTFDKLADRKLSLYRDCFQTESSESITLRELVDGIKGERWEEPTGNLRQLLSNGDRDTYKKQKLGMESVMLSGEISGPRSNAPSEGRLTHSGLLQIDIDAKDNPSLTVGDVISSCKNSPSVIAAWTSPSGEGVKAVVPIDPDLEAHRDAFLAAEMHFQAFGLKIDSAVKDPTRMMIVSHDPNLWINPAGAEVLKPLATSASTQGATRLPEHRCAPDEEYPAEEIELMLSYIPTRPPYDKWMKIAWAVFSYLPYDQANAALEAWSPSEEPGEYERLSRGRSNEPKVTIGTLIYYAKEHGYELKPEIPPNVIPLPTGGIGYRQCAVRVFSILAETRDVFYRGNGVCEVVKGGQGAVTFSAITPERFVELVETVGKRVAGRQTAPKGEGATGTTRRAFWRKQKMPLTVAKILLGSSAARELLPPLRQLVGSPLIVEDCKGGCEILQRGYHSFGGGTYVTSNLALAPFPHGIEVATTSLRWLLSDFSFASPSDMSRAVASLLSPALKFGGFIIDDFPLDVAEADQSQSGKTYRQKFVCALYGEKPTVITSRKGGVGSLDESVANALIAGHPFIALDNVRGRIDSALLETALRGQGVASCRGYRSHMNVDVTPFLWQLSTNGAELTSDLAKRSIITRVRKQPEAYKFTEFPEGDLIAHIKANRGGYLSAVYEVIKEWVALGKPQSQESRHEFRWWTRSLDWIVQNLFGLPPLMDGHRMEQNRTSNPKLQWLREVCLAVPSNQLCQSLSASQIVGIVEDAGIDIPGNRNSNEKPELRVGKLLGSLFKNAKKETLEVDGFKITRSEAEATRLEYGSTKRTYWIQRTGSC